MSSNFMALILLLLNVGNVAATYRVSGVHRFCQPAPIVSSQFQGLFSTNSYPSTNLTSSTSSHTADSALHVKHTASTSDF